MIFSKNDTLNIENAIDRYLYNGYESDSEYDPDDNSYYENEYGFSDMEKRQ